MAGFFQDGTFQNVIDYILIIGSSILVVYFIYNMIMENQKDKPLSKPPPYDDVPNSSQRAQLSSIEGTTQSSQINNASFSATQDNSLRNFVIKASSNSAYTNGYMNLNMIKYVLSKGCRFLDFEIYMKDGIPIVAYSTNKQSLETFTSEAPALSFGGVCSTIISNAFSEISPNAEDPLFLHLRIKTYDSSAYSKIAQTIKGSLGAKLYTESDGTAVPVTLDTQVTDFLGKIVVIVDQHSSPGFQNYASCETHDGGCYSLTNVINMVSNSQTVRTYSQSDLTYQPINPPDPSVYLFRIVYPNIGFFGNSSNSDSMYLIKNYGVQVIAQAFFINDANLRTYESLFSSKKSAFLRIEDLVNTYE
jgi:hypothetical protein